MLNKKRLAGFILILLFLALMSPLSCSFAAGVEGEVLTAQEGSVPPHPPVDNNTAAVSAVRGRLLVVSAFSAAIAIGVAAFGAALAQGNALARALEAIGRNPESQSKIFPTLVLGLAFIESLALYALLIALALVFFNPLISKL